MRTNTGTYSVFRVVIASPSDVTKERVVVRNVIDDLNNALIASGKAYQLQVVEQSDVAPGAGNPEERVSEQLEIPNCHIFIGIFWRRFGNPPKIPRPDDSSFYLSGTESEIDKAFAARKKNEQAKPEIMLYRKTDVPKAASKLANDEDAVVQHARVIEYFRKLEAGEKHQLLYATFNIKNFASKLRRDLEKICTENEDRWRRFDSQSAKFQSQTVVIDAEEAWLEKSPLKFNPFNEDIKEKVRLEDYIVIPCSRNELKRLMTSEDLIYTFGDKGAGKTTLLENILRIASSELDKELLKNEKIYCLRIGPEHFENQIEQISAIKEYQNYHFVRLIYQMVTDGIIASAQRNIPKPDVDFRHPSEALSLMLKWLRQEKYTSLLCLVDGLDEINSVKMSLNPELEMFNLVSTIVTIPKVEGIRLRLFLTSSLETMMRREKNLFRLDHYPPVHLEWSEVRLIQIINQRLQAASRTGANIEMGELCPEIPEIDEELARRASKNPRALLWLANRLFQIHFQEKDVREIIGKSTWLKLQEEWEIKKADFVFADSHTSFWIGKNRVPFYKESEIELPKILASMLCCLIEAKGAVCESEKLIRAAYPNEDPKYLMKTFYQQMGNLKKQLDDQIAPGWIQNVRGKGYRLTDPSDQSGEVTL